MCSRVSLNTPQPLMNIHRSREVKPPAYIQNRHQVLTSNCAALQIPFSWVTLIMLLLWSPVVLHTITLHSDDSYTAPWGFRETKPFYPARLKYVPQTTKVLLPNVLAGSVNWWIKLSKASGAKFMLHASRGFLVHAYMWHTIPLHKERPWTVLNSSRIAASRCSPKSPSYLQNLSTADIRWKSFDFR